MVPRSNKALTCPAPCIVPTYVSSAPLIPGLNWHTTSRPCAAPLGSAASISPITLQVSWPTTKGVSCVVRLMSPSEAHGEDKVQRPAKTNRTAGAMIRVTVVCMIESSESVSIRRLGGAVAYAFHAGMLGAVCAAVDLARRLGAVADHAAIAVRSEEHTSELQ